eukprot:jgi/Psemu1/26173/gm1.26173_g
MAPPTVSLDEDILNTDDIAIGNYYYNKTTLFNLHKEYNMAVLLDFREEALLYSISYLLHQVFAHILVRSLVSVTMLCYNFTSGIAILTACFNSPYDNKKTLSSTVKPAFDTCSPSCTFLKWSKLAWQGAISDIWGLYFAMRTGLNRTLNLKRLAQIHPAAGYATKNNKLSLLGKIPGYNSWTCSMLGQCLESSDIKGTSTQNCYLCPHCLDYLTRRRGIQHDHNHSRWHLITDYPGENSTETADHETIKMHLNSIIFTPGTNQMGMNISNMCEIINKYNLESKINADGFLADKELKKVLAAGGYYPSKYMPGLYVHKTHLISFTLPIYYFCMKYVCNKDSLLLELLIKDYHPIKVDGKGACYIEINLKKFIYTTCTIDDAMMHTLNNLVISKKTMQHFYHPELEQLMPLPKPIQAPVFQAAQLHGTYFKCEDEDERVTRVSQLDIFQHLLDSSLRTNDNNDDDARGGPLAFAIRRKRERGKKLATKATKKLFPSLSKGVVTRSNKLNKGHLCLKWHSATKAQRAGLSIWSRVLILDTDGR